MRFAIRSAGVAVLAIAAAVLLAFTSTITSMTITSMLTLAATTALIMGGTGHPLSSPPDTVDFVKQYAAMAVVNYIDPASADDSTGIPGPVTNRVAVITPEQFRFDTGWNDMTFDDSVAAGQRNLHNCITGAACDYNGDIGSAAPDPTDSFVVFGYSQSAVVATLEKRALAAQYPDGTGPDVSFLLIANPNRPNGGILERFQGVYIPVLGVTGNGATPTDTRYQTVDVSQQYDGWSDFPTNPMNMLADLNAGMGILYLHGGYGSLDMGDAVLQDRYGDTTYYLIPTRTLPVLMPVAQLPVVGPILADTLDPVTRVLVEAGYDRTVSPGTPTRAQFAYFPNPVALGSNLVLAVPTGVDNGVSDVTGTRPFGTQRPGPYGVGGPDVTLSPTTNEQTAAPAPLPVMATAAPTADTTDTLEEPGPRPRIGTLHPTGRGSSPGPATAATKPALPKVPKPVGAHPLRDLAASITKPLKPAKSPAGNTGSSDSSSASAGA